MIPKFRARYVREWLSCLVVTGCVLAFISPIFYMISMSLKTRSEAARDPLGLPSSLNFGNYAKVIESMNYGRAVFNSGLITVSVIAVVVLLGSLAAYPLARRTGTVSRIIIMGMALGLATPNFVTITPIYIMFRDIGLLDTYVGVIAAFSALKLPLAVFFYTGFISTIPRELEEAARLDNCGNWRTFFYVVFPLLSPVTATLALFVLVDVWNDFTYPLLLLTDPTRHTIMIAVYRFIGERQIDPTLLFPAAVLGSLPLLVLFVIFQRRIINNVTAGGVK